MDKKQIEIITFRGNEILPMQNVFPSTRMVSIETQKRIILYIVHLLKMVRKINNDTDTIAMVE